MKRAIFLALLISLACGLAAANRPIRFEDLFAVGRVSSPALSPNGRWLAYCVRTADTNANKFHTDLFLLDIKATAILKLESPEGSKSNPLFLDDRTLTFIASKEGDADAQLYALDPSLPKEAKKLSLVPGGIDNFLWTPDGKKILFAKEVYPEAHSLDESVKMESERDKSPVKAKVLTRLPFRIFNQWKDGKRSHVFCHQPGTTDFVDLTSGDFDTPPVDLGGPQDYGLSPDGKWLVYVKNTDPQVAISTNNDIFLKEMATGKEENLTAFNAGNDAGPVFSPKGDSLAYLSMKRAQFEADKRDIILYHPANKTFSNLTKEFANTVNQFVFSPDGKWVYFLAPQGLYVPIFQLEIKSGKITELVSKVFASDLLMAADGKQLIFLGQSVQKPNEVYSFLIAKRRLTQLTTVNKGPLQELEIGAAEPFTFKGAKDDTVEGILVKPPFFDPQKKYPLVFLVHGGPQGAWGNEFHFRWNMAMFAAPGYVVAGINFHGSHGYGQAFTDAVSRDWGGAPFLDLKLGQQFLVEHFPYIDKERMVAAGASYGGYMINWMAGHGEEFKYPFRCLISHDGIFDSRSMYYSTEELWFVEWDQGGTPWRSDLYEKWSPSNSVPRFSIPTLVIHGERDYRVPVSQGFMLFTALQRLGVKSKMLYFPDEDHFVSKPQNARLWWQTVLDWIAEHIR